MGLKQLKGEEEKMGLILAHDLRDHVMENMAART